MPKENPNWLERNVVHRTERVRVNIESDTWWRGNTVKIVISTAPGFAAVFFGGEIPQETVSKLVQWGGVVEASFLVLPLAMAWGNKAAAYARKRTLNFFGLDPDDFET